MKRVHFSQPHDVLIMRPGPWGNPFSSKAHASSTFKVTCRAQSLRYYQKWLLEQPDLIYKAKLELSGKVLACGCQAAELCHGDILLAVIYDWPLPLKDPPPESQGPTLF
jgi:hypothetical protein